MELSTFREKIWLKATYSRSAGCLSSVHGDSPIGRLYNPTTRISRQTLMTKHQLSSAIALIGLLFTGVTGRAQRTSYDFMITGARIVDGTGAPWFIGDIGIVGDHIAAIGDLHTAAAKQRIDVTGLVASPGFIDVQGQSEFSVLVDNRAASKITQGVTTEITGEGTSIAPVNNRLLEDMQDGAKKYSVALDWRSLDEYLRRYDRARPAINLGTFVGAGGCGSM